MGFARIAVGNTFTALAVGLLLAACATNDLADPPVPLGDFKLGLNVAVADNVQKLPLSRTATPDEWETAMTAAIADRFARYDGAKLYNIGVSVDGYSLAPPGLPVVLSPKSILAVTVTVWDDAAGTKLHPEGKQIITLEKMSPQTTIGSGLTQTKEQQMALLSYNVAKRIEGWLADNPAWFGMEKAN